MNLKTEWFHANKLSLNTDKTHFMVYHTRKKKYENDNIYWGDCKITQVGKVGVWKDEQLNWKSHITYISNKVIVKSLVY